MSLKIFTVHPIATAGFIEWQELGMRGDSNEQKNTEAFHSAA